MLSSKWVYISKNKPIFIPLPPPSPSPPYPKLGCSVLFSTASDHLLSTGCLPPDSGTTLFKVARYSFSGSIPPKIDHKLLRHKQRFGKIATNNNELYLHDHTSTYSIAKAIFRDQNYNTEQLRYFDNNLSRTSKQAEIYFMNCILIK